MRPRLSLLHAIALFVTAQQPPLPGYEPIAELSDEFDGTALDPAKWSTDPSVVSWPGRAPGLFEPSNVRVSNGSLQLWAQPAALEACGAGRRCWQASIRAPAEMLQNAAHLGSNACALVPLTLNACVRIILRTCP